MTKPLARFEFDKWKVKRELAAFGKLLGGRDERTGGAGRHPAFLQEEPSPRRPRRLLLSSVDCRARLVEAGIRRCRAHVCDLVVGQETTEAFSVVEFEDAKKGSVFKAQRGDRVPEWSPRLSRGFDQIVDWLCALDSIRHSDLFRAAFGSSLATFRGYLVIGRRGWLSAPLQQRLRWRSQKVTVDGSPVSILTYDELRGLLAFRASVLS
jgi:hypothetical protein